MGRFCETIEILHAKCMRRTRSIRDETAMRDYLEGGGVLVFVGGGRSHVGKREVNGLLQQPRINTKIILSPKFQNRTKRFFSLKNIFDQEGILHWIGRYCAEEIGSTDEKNITATKSSLALLSFTSAISLAVRSACTFWSAQMFFMEANDSLKIELQHNESTGNRQG